MIVLVINAGSSSVKFTLFNMADESKLAAGIVERIGLPGTRSVVKYASGERMVEEVSITDTSQAVALIHDRLSDGGRGILVPGNGNRLRAIGHRVVHGGEEITRSMLIDERLKGVIRRCFELAPLHNPPNLAGIEACEFHFGGVRQVAVFDTAFHATLPPHAYLYGLPYDFYEEKGIRRYGFHGISHQYVSHRSARLLGKSPDALRMISCHLGNGCSITAIDRGCSVDTSMGFTPLEGLIMGTRCGDIDPAIVFHLMVHERMDPDSVSRLLNKESGMLGLARIGSSDLRDIEAAMADGDEGARLAMETFCYRIKKYIGSYMACLGGLDVLIFTGGIGENSALVREMVCRGLGDPGCFGILLDPEKNVAASGGPRQIQGATSRVRILVVPTDEELEIARETVRIAVVSE